MEQHFPKQLEAYRRRYGSKAFVSSEYRERIRDLVESIRREHKLGGRYSDASHWLNPEESSAGEAPAQAMLPFQ